jgi:hypothetical protein
MNKHCTPVGDVHVGKIILDALKCCAARIGAGGSWIKVITTLHPHVSDFNKLL